MYKASDFIAWAVARAKPESVPAGAVITFPVGVVQPWEYLFGTTGIKCTQAVLDNRYEEYYSKHNWTLSAYAKATDGWVAQGVYVCDCEGLLDAFLGKDVTADYCYQAWCSDKGRMSEIDRPWVIGEAVFKESRRANGSWYKSHIGWVCGFMPDGEPVVVEERGIRYGCVITKLTDRPWTYRGLVTHELDYKEDPMDIRFEVVSPMHEGDAYYAMQEALKQAGYTDYEDKPLSPNGKWGKRSQSAFDKLVADYAPKMPETKEVKIFIEGEMVNHFKMLEE